MSTAIKIVARHYDKKTGDLLEEIEIRDDDVIKAGSLKELGYLHMEQIDIMSKCQDFRVLHQMKLTNNTKECPICGAGTQKHEVTPMSQTKNDSKRETFFINYRS